MAMVSTILGWGRNSLELILLQELRELVETAPRRLPHYNAGNPAGYGQVRPFQDYGSHHYGGLGSNIFPPISPEEFRLHFMFGSDKYAEALSCLDLTVDVHRAALGLASFPYRFYENGVTNRWVTQEHALLVFSKRLRTRGSCLIHLEHFFGRSSGWISEVGTHYK